MRNGAFSEVSGLTALPSPEFWHITAVPRPASQAPAAIATASPSLAAPTYGQRRVAEQAVDQRGQEAARHAGEEVDAVGGRRLEEDAGLEH